VNGKHRNPTLTAPAVRGGRRAGPTSGFTLIELLMVMALLSLVLGIGLGMFAALDPGRRTAVGIVQNILRAARNSSVARSAVARVRIDVRESVIRAEGMEVIGTWHFEDDSFSGAFQLDGVALGGGVIDPDGYQGSALSFLGEPRGARVEIAVQNDPAFDFRDGFSVELAVRLDEFHDARLLTVGAAFAVDVTAAGGVRALFVPEVVDEFGVKSPGAKVALRTAPGILRVGHWARLAIVYDRSWFRIFMDGVEVAAVDELAPVWRIDSPLVLAGDSQRTFPGDIDNLVVSAVAVADEQALPSGVRFAADTVPEIQFAPGGSLDPARHLEPLELVLQFDDGSEATVRVSLYGTVE